MAFWRKLTGKTLKAQNEIDKKVCGQPLKPQNKIYYNKTKQKKGGDQR